MLSYEQVLEKIESAKRFSNATGYEVMSEVMESLSPSVRDIPFIHVAGTNGKGSTCAFLDGILTASNLKVGRFTSPHLVDFEERITINGQMISKEEVREIGQMVINMNFSHTLTFFDYCLTIALIYFDRKKCDCMILETGLGGIYDSTNAVGIPKVSVITKIGYDHVQILGNTLPEIAANKAGIIKENTSLILLKQESDDIDCIFTKKAKEVRARNIIIVDEKTVDDSIRIELPLPGAYQRKNAALAVCGAVEFLKSIGKEADKDLIRKGLLATKWPGRMEIISQNPFVMLDGAHNGDGVLALADSLKKLYVGEGFHFIMGVMADKDYENMIEIILPLAKDFTTVTVDSDRALDAKTLADTIATKGIRAGFLEDASDIKKVALSNSGHKTVIFGSLYFVGEVKKLWKI